MFRYYFPNSKRKFVKLCLHSSYTSFWRFFRRMKFKNYVPFNLTRFFHRKLKIPILTIFLLHFRCQWWLQIRSVQFLSQFHGIQMHLDLSWPKFRTNFVPLEIQKWFENEVTLSFKFLCWFGWRWQCWHHRHDWKTFWDLAQCWSKRIEFCP